MRRKPEWLPDPYDDDRFVYGIQYPEGHDFHNHHHKTPLGSILRLRKGKWAAHVLAYGRGVFRRRKKAKQVVEKHVSQ